MLAFWTIQRATAVGIVAGLAALLVAIALGAWPEGLLFPYVGLLTLTALCGISILWITMADVRKRGRGGRIRSIRTFDVALALGLLLPSLYALRLVWPELHL